MSLKEQIITIAIVVLATMITRFLPFIIFGKNKKTPKYIEYLGNVLPLCVFGMLIVYCLKDVNVFDINSVMPQIIGILVTLALHISKRQMLLSIAGGTICYMILVQYVFV